jgi:hypothetical protein
MKVFLIAATVLGVAISPAAASSHTAKPLVARGGLAHLVVPGDRAIARYTVYSGSKAVRGTLYVRNDLQKTFARLRLQRSNNYNVRIPNRLIRGHHLFYYAVITDPRSHRSLRIPARDTATTWVLDKPVVVRLGAHRFGETKAPEAVVARATADQVGMEPPNPDELLPGFGPQTFLVGKDGSIWLDDNLNKRLLVWNAGQPDGIARTVNLPFAAYSNDIAFGPGGSIYVTQVLKHPDRLVLERLTSSGAVIWERPLGGEYFGNSTFVLGANSPLRTGPDGTLYVLAFMGLPGDEWAWMPAATPAGKAILPAAQRSRTNWPFQPVADGLRLLGGEIYTPHDDMAPHELRYALVDRHNRVVRSWRILSSSELNFHLTVPELAGGDPVVVVDFVKDPGGQNIWEYEVLRLGPHGTRARFSLAHSTFGSDILPDLRVGPDGKLYQLATSLKDGVVISRFSLNG